MYKMRKIIRKLGVLKTTILFTGLIMVISFLTASFIIIQILGWQLNFVLSMISIAIPMIIVPITMPFIFYLIISLDKTEEELQELSKMDSLTRIYNRYFIIQTLENEMKKIDRYGGSLSIAIFDVDDFKKINDTYGHVCGDIVLQKLSEKVQGTLRSADIVGRYGGEEFLIIMPMTSEDDAQLSCNRIKKAVSLKKIESNENKITVSISIGIAQYIPGESIEEFVNRADSGMYISKRASKKISSTDFNQKPVKKKSVRLK